MQRISVRLAWFMATLAALPESSGVCQQAPKWPVQAALQRMAGEKHAICFFNVKRVRHTPFEAYFGPLLKESGHLNGCEFMVMSMGEAASRATIPPVTVVFFGSFDVAGVTQDFKGIAEKTYKIGDREVWESRVPAFEGVLASTFASTYLPDIENLTFHVSIWRKAIVMTFSSETMRDFFDGKEAAAVDMNRAGVRSMLLDRIGKTAMFVAIPGGTIVRGNVGDPVEQMNYGELDLTSDGIRFVFGTAFHTTRDAIRGTERIQQLGRQNWNQWVPLLGLAGARGRCLVELVETSTASREGKSHIWKVHGGPAIVHVLLGDGKVVYRTKEDEETRFRKRAHYVEFMYEVPGSAKSVPQKHGFETFLALSAFHDIQGRPFTHPIGKYQKIRFKVLGSEKAGKQEFVEAVFLGLDGRPVETSKGISTVRFDYNSKFELINKRFFHLEGKRNLPTIIVTKSGTPDLNVGDVLLSFEGVPLESWAQFKFLRSTHQNDIRMSVRSGDTTREVELSKGVVLDAREVFRTDKSGFGGSP